MSRDDSMSRDEYLLSLLPDLPENLIVASGPMSRGRFLRVVGVGGLSISALGYLAACGGDDNGGGAQVGGGEPASGATAAERAINGGKALEDKGPISILFPSGTRDQIEPAAKQWTQQTGIEVKLIEQPQAQQLQRVSQEAVAKTGGWDIGVVLPKMMADLVSAGSVEDLTDYIDHYDPEFTEGERRMVEPLYEAVKFDGRVYAMPTDGDAVVAFGRSDLISNQAKKAAFEDKYGYELAAPDTWKQYDDIARFFSDPGNGLFGAVEIRDVLYGYVFFQCRWCSKAEPFAYWFDDDMNALINSEEAIAAAEEYVRLKDVMHPDSLSWGFTETYAAWAAGSAAVGLGWPSQVKTANTPQLSKIVGKQLNFRLPGSEVNGTVNHKNYQSFGNSYTVNKYGEGNKEAAYLFTQYLVDPDIGSELLTHGGFFDPYRWSHFTNQSIAELYTEGQMGPEGPLAQDMRVMAPDIILKGSNQYTENLARNLSSAFAGQKSVEQALNDTADAWNRVTDQQGRDEQVEAWLALKKAYPKA